MKWLTEGQLPDVITFAGNGGGPTLHPEFAGIIDDYGDVDGTSWHQRQG